jgi:hypothetical protein
MLAQESRAEYSLAILIVVIVGRFSKTSKTPSHVMHSSSRDSRVVTLHFTFHYYKKGKVAFTLATQGLQARLGRKGGIADLGHHCHF